MKFFTLCAITLLCSFNAFAITKTSTGTGNWNTAGTWTPSGVPDNGDDVIILAGHTVTLNTSSNNLLSLTVNGTLTIGSNNTDRTLTVTGNVSVTAAGTINVGNNNATHSFLIGGNLLNQNVFDLYRDNNSLCNATFNGSTNQTISGNGGTTDFNLITINNTGLANNNIVEILPTNFTTVADFLTLTRGIIKMSGSYTLSNNFIAAATYPVTGYATVFITANCGIWLNNPNVTVTAQNSDTRLSGLLRITAGTYNAGTLADWWFYYSNGAIVTIEGGQLNIAASFDADIDAATDNIIYTQSGGTLTTNISGNTGLFGNVSAFGIRAAGSTFTMTGGSIVIQNVRGAANTANDFQNVASTSTVTGGTIQIGNTSTTAPAINFRVNSTSSIYNLLVNNTSSPTAEIMTNTTVINDVTISTGGTLDVTTTNYNLFVGRNFINNGTFTQRLATVTFNGSALQSISGTSTTTFYNLTANNTAGAATTGISLQSPTIITNILALTNGHITTTATNLLTMNAGSQVSGANYGLNPKTTSGGSNNSFVNGPMRKIGNTNFLFPVGKVNGGHHPCGISAPSTIADTYTAEYIRGVAWALGPVSAPGLSHVSFCEYWDIARTVGSTAVNVTLSWNGSSNCNPATYVNDLATLTAAHFNGATWNSFGGANDPLSGVSSGSLTWGSVNTFSFFSLGSTSAATNPLPVKLVNVKAYSTGDRNKIEWTNLTETDVTAYVIERSVNGTQFETMSAIAARSNTNDKEDYYGYDLQRSPVTFYRIKVSSQSSKDVYSPIVKVVTGGSLQQDVSLYPNPVTGRQFTLQMNNPAGNYMLKIYAANGQVIKTETIKHPGDSFSKTIELPGPLQAGQYYLQISGGEKMMTSKFVVQ